MTKPSDTNSGLVWVCPVCGTHVKYDDVCTQCKTPRPIVAERVETPPIQPAAAGRYAKHAIRRPRCRWRSLVEIGLGLLMTGAAAFALMLAWESWHQLTFNGQDVTGQISTLFLHNDGSGEVEYLFKAADGTWVSGSQTVDRATYDGLRVNAPIAIRYIPGNPKESRLAANPPAFLNSDRIPLAFGLVFFGAGTIVSIASLRKRRRVIEQ